MGSAGPHWATATASRVALGSTIMLLGLGVTDTALASAITSATVTASGFTITPASGTIDILDFSNNPVAPLGDPSTQPYLATDASAGNPTDPFGSNPNGYASGTGTGSSTAATSPGGYAMGSASVSVTSISLTATSSVTIPDPFVAASVLPGASADLIGEIGFDPTTVPASCTATAGTCTISVSFGLTVTGSLSGQSDLFGFLQQDDISASLSLTGSDGSSYQPLTDSETLPSLPDTAGVNNYGPTTLPVSDLLTGSADLDPSQTYLFDLNIMAESSAYTLPEPGSLTLLLTGVGLAAWRRRARRREGYPMA